MNGNWNCSVVCWQNRMYGMSQPLFFLAFFSTTIIQGNVCRNQFSWEYSSFFYNVLEDFIRMSIFIASAGLKGSLVLLFDSLFSQYVQCTYAQYVCYRCTQKPCLVYYFSQKEVKYIVLSWVIQFSLVAMIIDFWSQKKNYWRIDFIKYCARTRIL